MATSSGASIDAPLFRDTPDLLYVDALTAEHQRLHEDASTSNADRAEHRHRLRRKRAELKDHLSRLHSRHEQVHARHEQVHARHERVHAEPERSQAERDAGNAEDRRAGTAKR